MSKRPAYDHNGPPVFDSAADIPEDVPKMHYFQCDINALWDVLVEMPFDLGGFYMRGLLAMYKHMEGLPADDNVARMRLGGIDIRTYRRMKQALLGRQKCFYEKPSGRVSNARFDEEITKYVVEFRNRQRAGLETAEKQRVARETQATSAGLQPDFQPTSAGSPAEVRATSGKLPGNMGGELSKKLNKNKDSGIAIAVHVPPQADRDGRAILELELELESKDSVCVNGARPGEEEVAPGLYVNCDTIRHREFAISIPSIAMQLATANLGLSKNEATPLARQSAIAHAMQWATEIGAGRSARQVLPSHIVNFIRGSVISQHNKQLAQKNAPAQPWRGGRTPANKPSRSEVLDAFHELEAEAQGATYRRID